MKPGIPWSVKGIEPETREAAKDAARRSGMTLGEWLNSMILDSAETPELEQATMQRYQRPSPPRDETSIRLEDIAEQLSRIARRQQDTAPAPSSYTHESPSEDRETLSKILNRIESNERQTVEAFSAVNERLAMLGRQMVQVKPQLPSRADDPAAFKSLETAVRNIVEHIEVSEKRTRDSLKSMQDRMAEMAQRATTSNSEQVLQSAPAISKLESRLSELAGRVERQESKPQSDLPDVLRKELSQLTERIEFVREQAEVFASKAQTSAVQTSQRELREIERRILSLLKEAQATFASGGGSTAEMQELRGEIATLNQRIDGARAGTASERDVHALHAAVEQLSTRVAQGPDMRPIADMDKRIADIAQRLEQGQAAARNNPQFGELERRMSELDYRLNDAITRQGDGRAQLALEQKISEVAERVGQTEHQLGHLETIERAINQLFESIEQNRTWAKDVAEDAANRMADRLMSSPLAGMTPLGNSPELQALEEGLRAVRESAIGADKRNQETLVAVHETLEQIVSKLAELETAAVGQQVAAAAQNVSSLAVSELSVSAPDSEPAAGDPQVFPTQKSSISGQVEGTFCDAEASGQPNPLSDWLETSQSPDGGDQVQANPGNADELSDDFIAAARRAAEAAANKSVLGSLAPGLARPAKAGRKGLKLPFMKAKAKVQNTTIVGEKRPPEIQPAVKASGNKRVTLLLAGLVLLAGVAAFYVNVVGKSMKTSSNLAPATMENKAVPPAPQLASAKNREPAATTAAKNQNSIEPTDNILTGSLSGQRSDATLASIIAQPGSISNDAEAPPAELGTEALRLAAEHGDAAAQFIIATRYLDGEGTQQDVTRAAHWYQKAAVGGLAPAQYRLATLFERGRGLPKDTSAALVWYQRASEQGNVKAMHNAAVLAAGNEAGKPNYDIAFKWFLAASQNGLKDSQFNLAVLYERGLGTPINTSEALLWYTIAAKQNDTDAQKRVSILSQSLAPSIVNAVQSKAQAWMPLQPPKDANVVTIQDPAWQQSDPVAQTLPAPGQLAPAMGKPAPAADKAMSSNDLVVKAQALLTKLGFNIGEPDGKTGSRTTNAIRLFQLQSGINVTGEITSELITQLQAKVG